VSLICTEIFLWLTHQNLDYPENFWCNVWNWGRALPLLATRLKHTGCVLRFLNGTDCYVWLYEKNLWIFMFEMHLVSVITDGWQGCEPHRSSAKRNVRTGPLPSLYFGVCYSFDFSRLLFFCVFRIVFQWFRVFV